MATPAKVPTIVRPQNAGTHLFTWLLNNNDAGAPAQDFSWTRAFFQVTGVFGSGGSVQIEGSNDGVNWIKLSPTALVAAGLFAALGDQERPWQVRPRVTAGDGTTALTVTGVFV